MSQERRDSSERRGCGGCLVTALLGALLAALIGFAWGNAWVDSFNRERMDWAPATATATRTHVASVSLDSSHRFAIQPFSVSSEAFMSTYPSFSIDADAAAGWHKTRLAILAEDVGGQFVPESPEVSWDGDSRLHSDRIGIGIRYLLIVELVPVSDAEAAEVTLAVTFHGLYTGSSAPPSGIDFVVEAEPIAVRPVSVVEASYTQTLRMSPVTNTLRLRLGLEGEARSAGAGGRGRLVLTARPVAHTLAGPSDSYVVRGSIDFTDTPYGELLFAWQFGVRAARGEIPGHVGADPARACYRQPVCERIDVNVQTSWYQIGNGLASGSPIPTGSTVTYVVEVRSYLLDTPEVPEGAGLTLESR
jgi:hypothetical protein